MFYSNFIITTKTKARKCLNHWLTTIFFVQHCIYYKQKAKETTMTKNIKKKPSQPSTKNTSNDIVGNKFK